MNTSRMPPASISCPVFQQGCKVTGTSAFLLWFYFWKKILIMPNSQTGRPWSIWSMITLTLKDVLKNRWGCLFSLSFCDPFVPSILLFLSIFCLFCPFFSPDAFISSTAIPTHTGFFHLNWPQYRYEVYHYYLYFKWIKMCVSGYYF